LSIECDQNGAAWPRSFVRAPIDRVAKTGALTVALGDAKGAYVVFGQRKVTGAK